MTLLDYLRDYMANLPCCQCSALWHYAPPAWQGNPRDPLTMGVPSETYSLEAKLLAADGRSLFSLVLLGTCLRACVPTCGPPAGFVATYPPTCSPCVLAPSIRQGCRAEGSGGTRDEGVVPAMWHYSRMLHAAFLCCMLPVLCCMLHLHTLCCTHAGRVLATSPADAVLLQPDFERCA